ncbi:MAG: VOC family protein [Acidobacteria bacterium]|nr:VOC family protein [Acidobacteriota bacterium]MBV9147053.1 VOC family protein [Acidobacteriota bacterium]MBV9434851.1 VOC family protein [Acidobacteriota bacterium]
MPTATQTEVNVKSAVPFFGVTNMEASLRFYIDGLGFRMKYSWIPDAKESNPEGKIRWCWLELGEAALMLQEFLKAGEHNVYLEGKISKVPENLGAGMSICFQCADSLALYREFKSRGVQIAKKPFVGNRLWCVNVIDPDGYKLWFNSPTDAPEESELEE